VIARTKFHEYELSRLMLGTVQFGLSYGIANTTGKPSYETVRGILATAFEGGVNCFDTAANYGVSEEVLGKALRELGIGQRVIVITKIVHMAKDYSSLRAVDEVVEESVVSSLKRLKLERLPICLFHAEENFRYYESLLKLKDKGLVQYIGSSTMTVEATKGIVTSGYADAVQIPTNVLDQRFIKAGIFAETKKRNVALFVRSIYLQGLLLMPEEQILRELEEVIPVRRKLSSLAAEAGMNMAELAVRYVLGLDGMTCTLVGVETISQMEQNIAFFARGPLEPDLMAAVTSVVPELSDKILVPHKWSKRMADVKPQSR